MENEKAEATAETASDATTNKAVEKHDTTKEKPDTFMDPDEIGLVGLDKLAGIADPKKHPLYDEKVKLPVDPNKVKNVDYYGVFENVICTKEGKLTLCVAGRQRVKWARKANVERRKRGDALLKVPVSFRRGDATDLFGITIAENECREEESAPARAAKVVRYMEMGHDEREAATAFGVSVPCVKNYMAIMDLVPEVRASMEAGGLTMRQALALAGLDAERQRKAAAAAKAENKGKHKAGRAPSKIILGKVFEECSLKDPKVEIVMRWVLGKQVSKAELASVFGGFEEVTTKKKGAKKDDAEK